MSNFNQKRVNEFYYIRSIGRTDNILRGAKASFLKIIGQGLFFLFFLPLASIAQPVITQQPENNDRCSGFFSNFTVIAVVAGNGAIAYQWQVKSTEPGADFVNIPAATSSNYNSHLTLAMNGWVYRVVVKEVATNRSVTSNPATLRVRASPLVTQPASITACERETVVFRVTVSGSGSFTYKWHRKLPNVAFETLAEGPNPTLQIDNVKQEDSGAYWAEAYAGDCPTPTPDVKPTLTVTPAPTLTVRNPAPTCTPLTVDLAASIVPSGSASGLTYSYFTDAAATNRLTSPNAVATSGTYYVQGAIGGTCKTEAKPVEVTIKSPPSVRPAEQDPVCSGGDTGIVLTDPDNTATRYKWTVNANPAVSGARAQTTPAAGPIVQMLTNSSNSLQTITYLVTPAASAPCPDGTPVSFTVTVSNLPAPNVTTNPPSVSACSGADFSAELQSTTPGTQYKWEFIPNDNVTGGVSQSALNPGPLAGRLELKENVPQQIAAYLVSSFGNNCYGKRKRLEVTVKPIPRVSAEPPTASPCAGSPYSIRLSDPSRATNTLFTWTVTVSPALTGTGGQNQSTPTTGPIAGRFTSRSTQSEHVVYTVTPVADGCTGASSEVRITVGFPVCITMQPPESLPFCSGEKMELRVQTSGSGIITYRWKKGEQEIPGAHSNYFVVERMTHNDAGIYSVAVSDGCTTEAISNPINVTVSPDARFRGAEPKISPSETIDYTSYADFSLTGAPQGSSLTWDFGDNTGTSPLPAPRHYYYAAGTFQAKLRAEITPDCFKEFPFTVTVNGPQVEPVIAGAEKDVSTDVSTSVYPNPVKETLYFKSEYPVQAAELYDFTGKNIVSLLISGKEGQMNVENLRQGIYLLRLKTTGGMFHFKVVKQ